MKNIPERIYLQHGSMGQCDDFNELSSEAITWSTEKINEDDIEYCLNQFKVELPTKEEINRKAIEYSGFNMDSVLNKKFKIYDAFLSGAKWLRDIINNQITNK